MTGRIAKGLLLMMIAAVVLLSAAALFAAEVARPGWDAWGNEAEAA
jgi:hypothetical protein